ncbi:tol-pal system-associated acyl-CoA thioesterase [Paracoccus onubensis]|uniref:Tol-pal system-associated acyl-CoA thioesterase n=1 Tax=Paracoccus onubensis TaxID=1675788 RepID=A0A418SQM7_9RHOB|nr:tol-pal system-associated acyl-CoA thioesterase [Paracoccus onubensis]RJE83147.1 tol-pal system-associated acyl-CoA thioesterase [Paracoccus onubensis]
MAHRLTIRVYYEDTDLAGIVYYANYLKFIERGRSEWLRQIGLDQAAMKEQTGHVFAVRRVEADYLRPAKFDDLLEVTTETFMVTPARVVLDQSVRRDDRILFTARVTIVCLGSSGRPARLPTALISALKEDADD